MKTFQIVALTVCMSTVFSTCDRSEREIIGDLAYFDLHGPVSRMKYNDEWYNFDDEGRLTFPGCEERKEDYPDDVSLILEYPDGDWDEWSNAKPFIRTYDLQGRLSKISIGCEDYTELTYDEQNRVISESWGAESFHGENNFKRESGLIKTEYSFYGDDYEEDTHEITDYPAYFFDKYGNWTRRFVLEHKDNNGLRGHVEERIIKYAEGAIPATSVSSDIVLTGSIGYSSNGSICFFCHGSGFCDGYYAFDNVCRPIRINFYNPGTCFLSFDSYTRDGRTSLGTFSGTLDANLNLYGTFTNNYGGTANFNFCGAGEHFCDLSFLASRTQY